MTGNDWTLARSVLVAADTAYALRPARTPSYLAAASLPVVWPAAELSLPVLTAHLAASALAVRRGALRSASGRVSVALDLASTAALVVLVRRARQAGLVLAEALVDGLGADYQLRAVSPRPGASQVTTRSAVVRTLRVHKRYVHDADIAYGPDGTFNHLDIWRDPDVRPGGDAPVLVQVPGGGYVGGNKQGQAYPLMSRMVEQGWLAVSINYRLAPKAQWPAQIIDVKRALAWVRAYIAEYGGDPRFAAVTGGSAGAHLAALAALTPGDPDFQPGFEDADTSVEAAVPLYGVYDWTPPNVWKSMQAYLLQFGIMTHTFAEAPSDYEQASPARRIGSGAPPFFVLHGADDVFAPADQARQFAQHLREAGGTVAYGELPGAQHAFDVLATPRALSPADAVGRFLSVVYGDWLRNR
jgi:acetyl esterase/lipase